MDLQRLFRYTTIKKRGYNVMISKEGGFACCLRVAASSNKRMHSDHKKRCSFLALLFVTGDAKREA